MKRPSKREARRVLVAASDSKCTAELEEVLLRLGHRIVHAGVGVPPPDADSLDIVLTDSRPLASQYSRLDPSMVVMVGEHHDRATVRSIVRAGACDLISRPFDDEALDRAIEDAIYGRALRRRLARLREMLARPREHGGLIGDSPPMQALRGRIDRIARTDAAALLTGESGTGKGHLARLLHSRSERSAGPFVAINCAVIPEHLLEAELFGHERGAFTGAQRQRRGLFVESDGGVLLLDEIDALPLHLQVKLLRALEERRVRPVGSTEEVSFDARLICATNCDLAEALASGRFRKDLYFRINVLRTELPPLRERGWDVLLLAQHFIEQASSISGREVEGFTPAAAAALLEHDWPGNVRELENCVLRAVALTRYRRLGVGVLELEPDDSSRESDPSTALVPLEVVELAHIARVMTLTQGNISAAARILGIGRKTLSRKLRLLGLQGHGIPGSDASGGTRTSHDRNKR